MMLRQLRRRSGSRGFTLLEVMVSMSILALALVAVAGTNANSFEASNYARRVTVATLLARSKMLDIELELQDDGFSENEQEDDGDFSEEGYSEMKWRSAVRPIEVDVGQLLGGFLGGDVTSDSLPEQMQMFLGAMNGEAPDEMLNEQVEGSELSKMLGGGQLELIFEQVGETLSDSIREISLEIYWGKEGVDRESIKFVQYVTTTGRLSVPAQFGGQLGNSATPGGRPAGSGLPPTLPGGIRNPALDALGKQAGGGGK